MKWRNGRTRKAMRGLEEETLRLLIGAGPIHEVQKEKSSWGRRESGGKRPAAVAKECLRTSEKVIQEGAVPRRDWAVLYLCNEGQSLEEGDPGTF